MNAFDYGPIQGLGGMHQAVVVYPKGTDWEKTGTVFDPWAVQAPVTYTIHDWAALYDPIRPSSMYSGSTANYPLLGGSYVAPGGSKLTPEETRLIVSLQTLAPAHYKYQRGLSDKERKRWVRGALERFRKRGHVFIDCPVEASVVDAQGQPAAGALKLRLTRSARDIWTEVAYTPAPGLKLRLQPLGQGPVTVIVHEDGPPEQSARYEMPAPGARQDLPLSPPGQTWPGARLSRLTSAGVPTERPLPANEKQSQVLFDNMNNDGVQNGNAGPVWLNFKTAVHISEIRTYHYGSQAAPGTIRLVSGETGRIYGPWNSQGLPGQGGVANAFWLAQPNADLQPGTYRLEVSNPGSWSCNDRSGGCGFAQVRGYTREGASSAGSFALTGDWVGTWSNSVGESGPDRLTLQEDASGNLSGTWSGNIPVHGRRLPSGELELHGSNSRRVFTIRGNVEGDQLVLRYTARRLDAPGSYTGECRYRRG